MPTRHSQRERWLRHTQSSNRAPDRPIWLTRLMDRLEVPRVAALVLVVGGVDVLLLLFPSPGVAARVWLVDLTNLAAAALATVCAGWRARRCRHRLRGSWLALTAACGAWSVGQLHLDRPDLDGQLQLPVRRPTRRTCCSRRWPGWPCCCTRPTLEPQWLRRVLDAAMTGLALGLVGSADGPAGGAVEHDHRRRHGQGAGHRLSDARPAAAGARRARRWSAPRAARLPLGLITVGLVAFAVADITFVYQQVGGDDPLSPVDVGWSLGFGCIALAALIRPGAHQDPIRTARGFPVTGLLPYLPVTAALVVAASLADGEPGDPTARTGGGRGAGRADDDPPVLWPCGRTGG